MFFANTSKFQVVDVIISTYEMAALIKNSMMDFFLALVDTEYRDRQSHL